MRLEVRRAAADLGGRDVVEQLVDPRDRVRAERLGVLADHLLGRRPVDAEREHLTVVAHDDVAVLPDDLGEALRRDCVGLDGCGEHVVVADCPEIALDHVTAHASHPMHRSRPREAPITTLPRCAAPPCQRLPARLRRDRGVARRAAREPRRLAAVSRSRLGRRRASAPLASPAGGRRDRDPVRHHRPARVDGPRPGAPPRARRRRLPRPLCDRRRRRVRRAGRADGRRGSQPRPDALRPDENARLYPPALSEGAGSLLPGETRPALVWTMQVDAGGEGVGVDVRRALVRSREKLDYAGVQRSLEDGSASEPLQLLREVGLLRQERERRRGGIDLRIPEQEVAAGTDGYTLAFRAPLPVEGWNAQISLMTGQAAAELMLKAQIGLLRTLPEADPRAVERLRRTARRSVSTGRPSSAMPR